MSGGERKLGYARSAIYFGWVRHRRYFPVEHQFLYRAFQIWLDLDELSLPRRPWPFSIEHWNLVTFRRRDFLGPPEIPLKQAVRERMLALCGSAPSGRICLLSHLRYLSHCFNPVSFYYGYDENDALTHILAEITNTPWGERHAYAWDLRHHASIGGIWRFDFDKRFHVSPFLPMNMDYSWRFSSPDQQLRIHMDVFPQAVPDSALQPRSMDGDAADDQTHGVRRKQFDATFVLERRKAFTAGNLCLALARFPFATLAVLWRIYWHALRLKLKATPFFDHPNGA